MASLRSRVLLFPFLAAHAVFPAMWLLALVRFGPLPNDWAQLKLTADLFVAGDWASLYAVGDEAANPGYYWRYPPFALYLVTPLAWLSGTGAYAVLAGLGISALAASLALMRKVAPFQEMRTEWVLAIALSAPALTTLTTGQSSGLILLGIAAAAGQWARDRPVAGAAILGLLALKPNWGVVFGFWTLVRGDWKAARTMLAVAALFVAATIPLGVDLWRDFVGTSIPHAFALEGIDSAKLISLRAFLEGVFGRSSWATWLWLLLASAGAAAAVAAWQSPGPPLRQLGIGVLLAIVVNPYAFFYDALVLALPATAWWAEREAWPRGLWLAAGGCIAAIWAGEQWLYSWGFVLSSLLGVPSTPSVSIVGGASLLWLLLAARQASTAGRLPAGGEA